MANLNQHILTPPSLGRGGGGRPSGWPDHLGCSRPAALAGQSPAQDKRSGRRRTPHHRRAGSMAHSIADMLRLGPFALVHGHEQLNDHGELRRDLAVCTAARTIRSLTSPMTLNRWESHAVLPCVGQVPP